MERPIKAEDSPTKHKIQKKTAEITALKINFALDRIDDISEEKEGIKQLKGRSLSIEQINSIGR